jgi:tetratricopeptide (TPR) repeat protein
VSRRTDLWSWGLLVLEMFIGRSPCCERGGPSAPDVLGHHLQTRASSSSISLPPPVAEVLQFCFEIEPAQRWASLAEAAEQMEAVYAALAGRSYPRSLPPFADAPPLIERPAGWLGRYEPPGKWLGLAYKAAGLDPTEAEERLPAPAATRKAQIVADLATYDEARLLLERSASATPFELQPRLVGLLVQQAQAHAAACDWSGARGALDQASALWQDLVQTQQRRELLPGLIRTLLHEAQLGRRQGEFTFAVQKCTQVIRLYERQNNRRARRDLRGDLATAYLEKALALRSLGDAANAMALFERALILWRMLVDEGQEELANDLAQACLSKASLLSSQGHTEQALELCEEAIQIRQRLVQRGQRDREGDLARAYIHKANVLRARNEIGPAVVLYDQAARVLERQCQELDRDDLAHELARAYLGQANAERARGDPAQAAQLCARAASIWERLVHQEGRRELTYDLARAYQHHGNALRAAGDMEAALCWCNRALELWQQLVEVEQRHELTNDLARGYISKANALRGLGQFPEALALYDQAIRCRERLLQSNAREDVEGELARDRLGRGELLLELGDRDAARTELQQALAALELAWRHTPRQDLAAVMNKAQRLVRELH